ncbi:hypothetical protein [Candidatus Hodarchaeum mangrovi]
MLQKKLFLAVNLIIVLCLAGCTSFETTVMISEARYWTNASGEIILIQVEETNFSALLKYDELNLSDLGLIFTLPYQNNSIYVPYAPLSHSKWLTYYLNAAENKTYPWNTSYSPQGSKFTYSYTANVTIFENITGEELLYAYEIHGDYYFEYNDTYNAFWLDRFKIPYENLSNYLDQFSQGGYYVSQKYRVLYGFLVLDSIHYTQFFLFNTTGFLKVGFFEFYWATTN